MRTQAYHYNKHLQLHHWRREGRGGHQGALQRAGEVPIIPSTPLVAAGGRDRGDPLTMDRTG
eukprot:7733499-Pyramimonas_sp.AAC.1